MQGLLLLSEWFQMYLVHEIIIFGKTKMCLMFFLKSIVFTCTVSLSVSKIVEVG